MKFISIQRLRETSSVWIAAHGVAETSRAFPSNVALTFQYIRCDALTCWRFEYWAECVTLIVLGQPHHQVNRWDKKHFDIAGISVIVWTLINFLNTHRQLRS